MTIQILEHSGVAYARRFQPDAPIAKVQTALDFIADAGQQEISRVLFHESDFAPAFYDLKTGLAGEILQKFSNYQVKAALVGEYKNLPGPRFREFMLESNRGNQLRFYQTESAAIAWLTATP